MKTINSFFFSCWNINSLLIGGGNFFFFLFEFIYLFIFCFFVFIFFFCFQFVYLCFVSIFNCFIFFFAIFSKWRSNISFSFQFIDWSKCWLFFSCHFRQCLVRVFYWPVLLVNLLKFFFGYFVSFTFSKCILIFQSFRCIRLFWSRKFEFLSCQFFSSFLSFVSFCTLWFH
jgi:hypothetical protein